MSILYELYKLTSRYISEFIIFIWFDSGSYISIPSGTTSRTCRNSFRNVLLYLIYKNSDLNFFSR